MSAKPAKSSLGTAEQSLQLQEVIEALAGDGLVGHTDAELLLKERRYYRGHEHPLVIVADQKWKSAKSPHRTLDLEALTQWLADKAGLEYFHIDPLKIDFSAVTDVMSNAYATRFRILPVLVTTKEVVIATAQPTVREWEREAKQYESATLAADSRRKLADTRARFTQLSRSLHTAEASMDPVLRQFRDQVLYLKHNLNAAAIGSLRGTADNIQASINRLLDQMNRSIAEADRFIQTLQ